MQIIYSSKARKQLIKIPKKELKKIFPKIEKLALNPMAGKNLKGDYEGCLSLKAWPYRIIYRIEKNILVIYSIAHRQNAYK